MRFDHLPGNCQSQSRVVAKIICRAFRIKSVKYLPNHTSWNTWPRIFDDDQDAIFTCAYPNAGGSSLNVSMSSPTTSIVMNTEAKILLPSSTSAILDIPAPVTAAIINNQYDRFLAQQSINKRDSSFQPSFVCFQHLKQISLSNR